jgi:ribonucleoside-diphosphate reductase beta chain
MSIFDRRYNYKPFEYSNITNPLIDAMWAGHWTVNEFSFSSDIQDFRAGVSEEEREILKKTLLLISQVEVAVKNYWGNIGTLLPKPEIGELGAVFSGVEVIHSRAYSEILNKLSLNNEFEEILKQEAVKGRVAYLTKYNDTISAKEKQNICYSLALFTLFTENVSLFSQFFIILGFNRFRGLFKDISNVVQYTSKEENLHAEGGMALLKQIRKEHPELFDDVLNQRIISEAHEALKAESELIDWILGGYENEFVSKDILTTFLKRRLNDSLVKIGYEEVFELDNNLVEKTLWMDDEIYASALTDFFHKRPIEYQKKMKSFEAQDLF